MIKKLSIIALSVMGIVLAGCSNQAKTDTDKDTNPKTEKVTKDKTNDSKKIADSKSTNSNINSTDNNAKSQGSSVQTSNKNITTNKNNSIQNTNSTTNTTKINKTSNNTNKTSKNQPTTTTNKVTNGEESVTYLFSKLTNLDKTKISGLYNGTVYDIDGKSAYRVNLYRKGESQPYTAYNVYADGTYTQVW